MAGGGLEASLGGVSFSLASSSGRVPTTMRPVSTRPTTAILFFIQKQATVHDS